MSGVKQSGDCKNRNSHIEETAVTTCFLYRGYLDKKCAGNRECDFDCHHYNRCEKLYEKGYQKQSEVIPKAKVEEMLQQIETLIIEYLDGLYTTGEFMEIFGELKKKYTEEVVK